MNIETLATSYVISEISKTDRLSPYISNGDKEPCWDGNIYIHSDSKKTIIGIKKVPVQVKGKQIKSFKCEEEIKYSIKTEYLNAYLKDGGVILFVVYLDKNTGDELQTYYADLLPLKIKEILKNKNKNNSVSIKCKRFPKDNYEKVELFLNFYDDMKKQTSFSDVLINNNLKFDSFKINYTFYRNKNSLESFEKMLEGKSLTIYGQVKGLNIEIPLQYFETITDVRTLIDRDLPISVNNEIFYENYKIVNSSNRHILHIGSCVNIYIDDEKNKIELSCVIKGTLSERILGVKLIISILDNKYIQIGDYKIWLNIEDINYNEQIDFYKKVLSDHENIKVLLEKLHVKKVLDLDKITKKDDEKLGNLFEGLINKKVLKIETNNTSYIGIYNISNVSLAIVYMPTENGCRIYDLFDNHFHITKNVDDKTLQISQFFGLKAEHFLKFDNLNLNFILEDIKLIDHNEYLVQESTLLLLEALKAYDICKDKEIVEFALNLAEWLLEMDNNFVTIINYYQVVKRIRKLDLTEKSTLMKLLESTEDLQFRYGIYILLDENTEADNIYTQFDSKVRELIDSYPISNLKIIN